MNAAMSTNVIRNFIFIIVDISLCYFLITSLQEMCNMFCGTYENCIKTGWNSLSFKTSKQTSFRQNHACDASSRGGATINEDDAATQRRVFT